MRDPDKVYLVDGVLHAGPYAALSYCWGGERELVLESATAQELHDGMDLARFPATLCHAIRVTQSLGIRYIWIDALCILQDSKEDWAREAARMSQVYRGSAITIEAASANKASDGFFKQRPSSKPYVELQWRSSSSNAESVQMRPIQDIVDTQLTDTAIFSRGWTMQERLLAPRTLSFGEQQMSFECASGYEDEARTLARLPRETDIYLRKDSIYLIRSGQSMFQPSLRWLARAVGIPRSVSTPFGSLCTHGSLQVSPRDRGSYYDYWRVIVERYSQRELSHPSDRLPALSGLAKEIQSVTGDTYCAGLWWGDLVFSLAWTGGDLFNAKGRFGEDKGFVVHSWNVNDWPGGIQSTEYVAPSWSWASITGRIEFPTVSGLPLDFTPLSRVLRVILEPRFTDSFGLLAKGHLHIEGPVLHLPTFMLPSAKAYPWHILHEFLRVDYVRLTDDHATEVYQHHKDHAGQSFALFKLLIRKTSRSDSLCCLLLESCGDGTWRRLCLAQMFIRELPPSRTNSAPMPYKLSNPTYDPELLMDLPNITERVAEQIASAPWKMERLWLS